MLFFLQQKKAYELRISDWSSDVCSSDLAGAVERDRAAVAAQSGHGTQDHVVGRSLERVAAIFHARGDVVGHGAADEEFAPAGAGHAAAFVRPRTCDRKSVV